MASSDPSRINEATLRKSVKALLHWKKLQLQESKHDDDVHVDDFMYLLLTLKQIPPKQEIPHRIHLPHPLQSQPKICLILADGSKNPSTQKRITLEDVQKMLKSQDIPISKVIKLSKLKSAEYNSFEAKKKLCDSFDLFLADKRIVLLLPKLLGKQFYKKKRKVPVPVDLKNSANLKEEVEKACSSSLLCFGSGTCSVIRIGRWGFTEIDQIVDNVLAAINAIVELVPKKWAGVRAFHLKFSESLALPIYETKQKKADEESR